MAHQKDFSYTAPLSDVIYRLNIHGKKDRDDTNIDLEMKLDNGHWETIFCLCLDNMKDLAITLNTLQKVKEANEKELKESKESKEISKEVSKKGDGIKEKLASK